MLPEPSGRGGGGVSGTSCTSSSARNGSVGIRRGESQDEQIVQASQVEGIWRQEVAQNPNLIAAVKTHPDAPHKFMIDVLDGLQSAGSSKISLQILE